MKHNNLVVVEIYYRIYVVISLALLQLPNQLGLKALAEFSQPFPFRIRHWFAYNNEAMGPSSSIPTSYNRFIPPSGWQLAILLFINAYLIHSQRLLIDSRNNDPARQNEEILNIDYSSFLLR